MTPTSSIALQLYTVRDHLAEDITGTLRRVRDLGYRDVELFGFVDRVDEYAVALDETGLVARSAHATTIDADLDALFAAAVRLGVGTVIDPYIDPKRWHDRASVEQIAAHLNRTAQVAAEHGVRFGYHNHHFELESRIDEVPALEILVEALSDDVLLEIDTYWAEVGGVSAVEVVARLGERVQFLHIKDGPRTLDVTRQVAVGAGEMPVVDILATAPWAQPVVELDDFTGDIFVAVADSLTYLEGVRR